MFKKRARHHHESSNSQSGIISSEQQEDDHNTEQGQQGQGSIAVDIEMIKQRQQQRQMNGRMSMMVEEDNDDDDVRLTTMINPDADLFVTERQQQRQQDADDEVVDNKGIERGDPVEPVEIEENVDRESSIAASMGMHLDSASRETEEKRSKHASKKDSKKRKREYLGKVAKDESDEESVDGELSDISSNGGEDDVGYGGGNAIDPAAILRDIEKDIRNHQEILDDLDNRIRSMSAEAKSAEMDALKSRYDQLSEQLRLLEAGGD